MLLGLCVGLSPVGQALAELPKSFPLGPAVRCELSAAILFCRQSGTAGFYAISKSGTDTYARGYDAGLATYWAQTSSQYGRFSIFSGVSGDGQVWFGSSKRIGWNMVSNFSTSSGDARRISCNRISGCN
ncbi:hypothetical protein [Pseudomonas sp. LRF_L74]|uniref:hypothetical protein n=1 Tax=Pseudomonas sp. LRF_L74 TaxID=3369422 RepID=UPI003F5F43B7